MRLTKEEVKHIALLARLGLSKAETERFQEQLSKILEAFQTLQEVDTQDVPPTAQSINLENIVREDKISISLTPEEVLANAPRQEEGYFRVKAVLE